MLLEQIIIYGITFLLCGIAVFYYLRNLKKETEKVKAKIEQAKEDGLHEPISLHPVIDLNTCIKSAACVTACPEKDILGIVDGIATLIQSSNCVGHGACFHACPVEAISLVIGTAKRGVDLPHVNENYETNVGGVYIAGELGGMGLIKNSVEQGKSAVENIAKLKMKRGDADYDLIIIGAGPAGIAGSLMAKKLGVKFLTLEQDTLGGTVYTFPRAKIVMTAPMDLPLYGKVKLYDTRKGELLKIWEDALSKNDIVIQEKTKVEEIKPVQGHFLLRTNLGIDYTAKNVLLAIGRQGSPRKLNIPGEMTEKVAYRLLEPELVHEKKVVVVGGGDSAVEAALSLIDENEVILSYRKDKFSRIKPKNREKILAAIEDNKLRMIYNSNLVRINPDNVIIRIDGQEEVLSVLNDLVYIFAGGELPTQFLQKAGVEITRRFGYTMKKY